MLYCAPQQTQVRRSIITSVVVHALLLIALFTFARIYDEAYAPAADSGDSYEPAAVKLYDEPTTVPTPAITYPAGLVAPEISTEAIDDLATVETPSESTNPTEPASSTEQQPETAPQIPIRTRAGRANWYKDPQASQRRTDTVSESAETAPKTAHQLAQQFSKVGRERRRSAEAVYNLRDAQSAVNAQMHEIMDGRYRHQVVMALHAASLENQKPFHSHKNLEKKIDIKIILDVKGTILSVEFVQSTGYPELDAYIVYLIKLVKKFPKPRNVGPDACYALSIPTVVTCDAKTQVLGFLTPGGGDYFG